MSSFISAKEAAERWNISQRRVSILCSQNRIVGAATVGNMWIIPSNAKKPVDKRKTHNDKPKNIELKPFIKWAGGKSQLVSELEKLISTNGEKIFTKYAEPFVGGGALLFSLLSKRDFARIYIGDINAELINAYRVVKTNIEKLIIILRELQSAYLSADEEDKKRYYYSSRERFNLLNLNEDSSTEKAALFIFLNKTCFNGLYRVNRSGKFNVPMGSYKKPVICDENNLRRVSEALQSVTIVCGDYGLSGDFIDDATLVYLDPPYRPISETASFTAYNADVFDDKEQRRLAGFVDSISAIGAKVILSNSDPKNTNEEDDFFEQLYGKYKINKVEAARMINSKSDKRGKVSELLICN